MILIIDSTVWHIDVNLCVLLVNKYVNCFLMSISFSYVHSSLKYIFKILIYLLKEHTIYKMIKIP